MKTVTFVALLVVGLVVLAWGYNASESFNSKVSEFFGGEPTQKSTILLVTGGALAVLGATGLIMSGRRS